MKLHQSTAQGINTFTGYGEGYVLVNGERRDGSFIVLPDRIEEWGATSFDALAGADLEPLYRLGCEILLLGTGPLLRFPRPELHRVLSRRLAETGAGLEVMDVQAACRTYNILVAEQRKVAAALLMT